MICQFIDLKSNTVVKIQTIKAFLLCKKSKLNYIKKI